MQALPRFGNMKQQTMTAKVPGTEFEHEVYALTRKGDAELHGAETSLSPADIELLVRIDGISNVAQIKAGTLTLATETVVPALQKLRADGLIKLCTNDPFSDKLRLAPTKSQIAKAGAVAIDGVSTLIRQGYFVRIARRRTAERKLAAGETLSVIVVEDEPHLAKFLKQYLAFEGFNVRIAVTRNEIVNEFRTPPPPDLVILDVMLPDADGFDILFRMRQHPVLKSVPVIMLTAKATREAVLNGLARGADGYITKPFEVDVLVKAVNAVLGLKKSAAVVK